MTQKELGFRITLELRCIGCGRELAEPRSDSWPLHTLAAAWITGEARCVCPVPMVRAAAVVEFGPVG